MLTPPELGDYDTLPSKAGNGLVSQELVPRLVLDSKDRLALYRFLSPGSFHLKGLKTLES